MRKLPVFCAAALLALGLSFSAFKPSPPPGASANGEGGLIYGGELQTFSFHASAGNGGIASGSFELKSRTDGQELRLHGTIVCMTILPDRKTAFISGIVTQRVGDDLPGIYEVGQYVYFEVRDNGEGRNNAPDEFSDVLPSFSEKFCGDYSIPLFPIVNGNIQVKP